ncbi:MAG TPA: DUF4331 domain-containing protein [Gaiellaceae bacterium]|jgi:Domain of unknown function (DUF4331)|nr:DUF4331 domain-containing protein [Gaiellaceae bacterium]
MSSHREAPAVSQDPVADNADTYAFVSPDDPTTVTIITNYVPLEGPPGGPNFFEFGDDVLYSIYVDNDGDALPEITYQFRFHTTYQNPNTFLYNTGPIGSLADPNWNKRQLYSVSVIRSRASGKTQSHAKDGKGTVLAGNLACPPCNVGPRSTPNYAGLAAAAVHQLPSGETVFAGQRSDGFFVDLGAIFDLGDIRPIQNLHLIPTPASPSVDPLKSMNVHAIAIKVPISKLTKDGSVPSDPMSAIAVLGIWGGASRRKVQVRDGASVKESGPWVQVSRLGNPLFNEVIVPVGHKDRWNALDPIQDAEFVQYVKQPELAKLLPVLYPGAFPNLKGLTADRADLEAILLTGIPSGVIPGFQNFTGKAPADMLRLNVAVPPAKSPNALGVVGGDFAGFPNGRRVFDDVVSIELKAVAGATYPLVAPSYTPDAAIAAVSSYLTPSSDRYQSTFPYLGVPHDGYDTPSS